VQYGYFSRRERCEYYRDNGVVFLCLHIAYTIWPLLDNYGVFPSSASVCSNFRSFQALRGTSTTNKPL
jgi:hypothetical protein